MNVLITGSSGSLGRHLMSALATDRRFHSVVGVDVRWPEQIPSGSQFLPFDITKPMSSILREYRIDAVVHAAFIVRPLRDKNKMVEVNIGGSANVLASCVESGIRQLVHLSSATVYGFDPNRRGVCDESTPWHPGSGFVYGDHKRAAETLLAFHGGKMPTVTILRPCFLIGRHISNPLLEYLARRVSLVPRRGALIQLTHMEDIVEIIRLFLLTGKPGVFNVGGEGALDPSWMARRLGNISIHLPYGPLSVLNDLVWRLRLPLAPTPPWALRVLQYPWIVSSRLLKEAIGYRFRYTTSAAFEDFMTYQTRRH